MWGFLFTGIQNYHIAIAGYLKIQALNVCLLESLLFYISAQKHQCQYYLYICWLIEESHRVLEHPFRLPKEMKNQYCVLWLGLDHKRSVAGPRKRVDRYAPLALLRP